MGKKFKVALLGIGGRAGGFASVCKEYNNHYKRRRYELATENKELEWDHEIELVAICDNNKAALENVVDVRNLHDVKQYLDYKEMLDNEEIDMVFVGTPIDLHCEHSIMALERNINVMGEVPVCGTIEQCKQLVKAEKQSKASYVFAENACYFKPVLVVKEMIKAGLFGEVYYSEGEYIHDLKYMTKNITKWRAQSMYGRNGIVYGTHSVGPVMSWFDFDRIKEVSCRGSGRHFSDSNGNPFNLETTTIMLGKTEKDRLIKIKNDFASPRPGINQYVLQGTKGAFESRRPLPNSDDYIWLEDYVMGTEERWWIDNEEIGQWMKLSQFSKKFLPQKVKEWESFAVTQGHDGADVLMFVDLVESLMVGEKPYLDIHRGLDLTLPGIISQVSISNGGEWVEVPDSREW